MHGPGKLPFVGAQLARNVRSPASRTKPEAAFGPAESWPIVGPRPGIQDKGRGRGLLMHLWEMGPRTRSAGIHFGGCLPAATHARAAQGESGARRPGPQRATGPRPSPLRSPAGSEARRQVVQVCVLARRGCGDRKVVGWAEGLLTTEPPPAPSSSCLVVPQILAKHQPAAISKGH